MVVLIGDLRPGSDFGPEIRAALQDLEATSSKDNSFELVLISDENGDDDAVAQLLREVARSPMAGVLVASTSARSPAVLRVCRALRLPTLILLATNNNILREPSPTIKRLVPTDTVQAAKIRQWLDSDKGAQAIFYEQGIYGTDLAHSVADRRERIYRFSLDSPPQISYLVEALNLNVRTFVFIGYTDDVRDAILKLDALCARRGIRVQVLVSDGAYKVYRDRPTLHNLQIHLTFPMNLDEPRAGFGQLAVQATPILLAAWHSATSPEGEVRNFAARAKAVGMQFDGSERTNGSFTLLPDESRASK